MWNYIKTNNLQKKGDGRVIECDAKFKEICDGEDSVSAFALNKYISKYFKKIPKEEQNKYKQILREREEGSSSSSAAAASDL